MNYDVTVLTDRRYILEKSDSPYIQNVLLEDQLVCDALTDAGLRITRKAWDDPHFDFSSTRAAIFRTTWDYFDRFNEFLPWLKKTSQKTRFINSMNTLLWNIDKHYLLDLQDQGIPVIPSYFMEISDKRSLSEHVQISTWDNLILKPAVSGAGRHTYRLNTENIAELEPIYNNLIQNESMLLQPFQENIIHKGEISLMLFSGTYSHAVLKTAKVGDFRVQDDFGGQVHDYTASAAEIAFAEKAVQACKEMPIYARVDLIWDNQNALCVSELELIEPELWFRKCPAAAKQLTKAVKALL